ncbi:hypothetical protein QQS21_010864 [Conoideocrella luteorostrata]|uniref:Heterokaryon incompatibility domain-containing protein n=1 Tax=Conoideocrella luteorostrata TaxID=1105319 RepID=A0AAJ0CE74_9HYPO|nr:hypothetical protein QQS21_010864 [Conoideocrella luteorostrata]
MSTTAADVTAALQHWHAESYPKQIERIEIAHKLSETWENRVNDLSGAYNDLEKRRMGAGVARMPWQDAVEAKYYNMWASRKVAFKHFPEWLRRICPLSVHLARYQGRTEEDDDRRLNGWRALLEDWSQVHELMTNDKNFRKSLSPTQEQSYHLLRLWWASTYCDEELLAATRKILKIKRTVQSAKNPLWPGNQGDMAKHIKADASKYHESLFKLFLHEIHPMCWEPNLWQVILINLQDVRYKSSCLAAVQQMAYSVLHPGNTRQEPYPKTFKNDEIRHRIASTKTSHYSPYYLWDTESNRTVAVEDLPMCPEYICISHTWGRWRTRTNADIPGVPWPVPENRRFDVKGVPEKLRQIGHRFIWFDLFCIPQTRNAQAAKEIANQASIFKGSSNCIAWINDVNSWDGVLKALYWIGLKSWTVISPGGAELVQDKLVEATRSAEGPMELMLSKPDPQGISSPVTEGVGEPAGWFSSLWTLQECALCPDMQLYNYMLERLEDGCGTPITLRALMVIIFETGSLFDKIWTSWRSACPAAVRHLREMSLMTRLDEVLTDGSPVPIVVHSNSRESTSNRAPAIMSAIGVTDWYLPSINNKIKEPLVHGIYPLSFVREAAIKLGAQFYGCGGHYMRRLKKSKLWQAAIQRKHEGSMLPFVKSQGWYSNKNAMYNSTSIDSTDHDSVSSWTINGNGSVSMRSVGIVMTSEDETSSLKGECAFACAAADGGEKVLEYGSTDMLTALKSAVYSSRCLYAVALYEDGIAMHGVLLEQLPFSMSNKQYLVKVGVFFLENHLPPAKPVHWEVL